MKKLSHGNSRRVLRTIVKSALYLSLCMLFLGLSPGDVAPSFEAKNQDGKVIHLSDFKGKPVLIYFYPKDETKGCTKEACQFRDEYSKFRKKGAVILGVSRQNENSHKEFREKHKLPFDLLVDQDGSLAESYGVGKMPVIGLLKRESILVGPDGKIAQVYTSVDPETHADQVLKDLAALSK